ncbi:MAG: AraC family transcriptional regulator [Eubacterium sp.]|jgi:AraC-like DNA-binding protein|nr:AraC family transcriptional regulator [Eubacterium sp.]
MEEYLYGRTKGNFDLSLFNCGMEECKPGHFFGPAVRDHYLIHYILSGKGYYKYGEKVHQLNKGQGFLICPEKVTYYQADSKEPWTYCWVGFTGHKAGHYLRQAGLDQDTPVFAYDADNSVADCILNMITVYQSKPWNETGLLSLLYLFLSLLIGDMGAEGIDRQIEDKQEYYIRKVIEYVNMNYSRKIRISDIASHIGLDRSYLGALFKQNTKKSLQQYLLEHRVNKACELMKDSRLSISDVSRSVGYDDPLLFSKMFKKVKGLSPRNFSHS